MRNTKWVFACLSIILLSASFSSAQTKEAVKFDELVKTQCDDMMAHLDNYAVDLQLKPNLQAYIVSYGGGRGQSEARAWAVAAKKYLVSNRGIEARRVTTLYGGNREQRAIELWLLPNGYRPSITDTIRPKGVRFKKSRMKIGLCDYL